jgi:hypothetical protein
VWCTAAGLLVDVVGLALSGFRSRSQLAAENLFLRKQLALYRERQVKPRRADDATRITLVMLSHLIDWKAVLTIVKPDTLIRWHRKRIPFLLAVEVEGGRPTTATVGRPATDCRHGSCERDVGGGADCRGTASQTWPSRVATDGAALHATE